jgi:hypothetical protein
MLYALYVTWNDTPPAHLQLARIASFLGAATGVKPPRTAGKPTGQQTMTADDEAFLAGLPVRPMPKVMSRDEYLAQRENAGG